MDFNLIKNNPLKVIPRLQEGQIVLYEGVKAKIIRVEPLLTIKVKDRIICGDLNGKIEFLKDNLDKSNF